MTRFALLLAALAALVVAGCGSSHNGTSSAPGTGTPTTLSVSAPVSTPSCASSNLAVWLGVGEGGGTAGTTFYPLELTNISGRPCHLRGFPGVSAWNGHQLGSPANRDHALAVRMVTLAHGETAHALVGFTDVGNFSRSSCKPKTAEALRVFTPGERSARFVRFSFEACSSPRRIFLSVRAVERGVGIPGSSH